VKILRNPYLLNSSPLVLIISKKELVHPRPPNLLCNTSFNIILPSTTRPCEWSLSFWIPHQTPVVPYALRISSYDLNIRVSHIRIRYTGLRMRSRRVASQHVTPEHAPDFNYNRSFSYKRPADEAVCRSRGRHAECTAYWEGCVPLEWKLGGGGTS